MIITKKFLIFLFLLVILCPFLLMADAPTSLVDCVKSLSKTGVTERQSQALFPKGPVGKLFFIPNRASSGTTGGKWCQDAEGTEWFVKTDSLYPELQTASEVISSSIYRFLGFKAPETVITTFNGKRVTASRNYRGDRTLSTLDNASDPYFKQLQVWAAYLKDWDRLRLGPNNLQGDLPNDYVLLDFAGTLGARAQGKHKPGSVFSEAIGAFESNPSAKEILDGFRVNHLPQNHPWRKKLEQNDVDAILRKLETLQDPIINRIVDLAQYSKPTDSEYMKRALKARRDSLINGLREYYSINGLKEIKSENRSYPSDSSKSVPALVWTHDKAKIHFNKFSPTLPPEKSSLLLKYNVGGKDILVNSYLEGNPTVLDRDSEKRPANASEKEEAKKMISDIDTIFDLAPALPEGLTLYRGKATKRSLSPPKPGDTIKKPAFLSTSINKKVADEFIETGYFTASLDGASPKDTYFELSIIKVASPSVKGIYIPSAIQGLSGSKFQEAEILVNRGTHLRVKNVTTRSYEGGILYVVEYELF